jgi:hypothetical protein
MSGNLAMGTNKVTGLGTPTTSTDAATKGYVDTASIAPSNLTGPITSVGPATSVAAQTGTGSTFVMNTSPTLVTPVLGVATATSINGTTIPASKTLVATDSTAYVVPSQTGNANKFLKTDGTTSTWAAVAGALAQPTEPSSPDDGQIWVDTDGSVVGQAVTRWSKVMSAGVTAVSGLDDSSVTLTYTSGYEQVYRNGVLLSRGNDYTATTGTSITLIDATLANDVIEIIGSSVLGIADVYTQAQTNAAYIGKALTTTTGDMIYASAANTPARLGIGSTDQILKVSGGIPVWATPAASGSMTLLSTTSLSGASTTISSISQSYKHLYFELFGCTSTISNGTYKCDIGSAQGAASRDNSSTLQGNTNPIEFGQGVEPLRTSADNWWGVTILNYASTTTYKAFNIFGAWVDTNSATRGGFSGGGCPSNTAVSSLTFSRAGAGLYSTGTVKIYGVN